MNQVSLTGRVVQVNSVRFTPAGLPVVEMLLEHMSSVTEAGTQRTIQMTCDVVALGPLAQSLADTPTGTALLIQGFLAPARKGSVKLVVHVQSAQRVDPGSDPVVV